MGWTVLDLGQRLLPIEIKSGETVVEDFFEGLEHWRRLTGDVEAAGALVYGGERSYQKRGFTCTRGISGGSTIRRKTFLAKMKGYAFIARFEPSEKKGP